MLAAAGVPLERKGMALGFRVEHPQAHINRLSYGPELAWAVRTGKARTDELNAASNPPPPPPGGAADSAGGAAAAAAGRAARLEGKLPVASYRLAASVAAGGAERGAYSFCMCPGGQIVPSSTEPGELCVNGMSFSRRDSVWANAALVVSVPPDDPALAEYEAEHGVLAGMAFQREIERRAFAMGGGDMTCPVQRVPDFLARRPSRSAPSSSYRLGVRPGVPCHELYPRALTDALAEAIETEFERAMPGFACDDALLHAVETRTSAPLRVPRDDATLQSPGVRALFPAGEGAGYAGGIVSAACDGMRVARAVVDALALAAGPTP